MRRSRLSLLFWTGLASSTMTLAACRDHVETIIVDAVVGERGLLATWRASDQYDAAALALEQLKTSNEHLRDEIGRLKDDPAAIEELARGELGLMKPGEKVFIVKDLKPQDKP